jgi:hypothetical protein
MVEDAPAPAWASALLSSAQDTKLSTDRVSATLQSTLGDGSWLIGGFLDLNKRVTLVEATLRSTEAASAALPESLQRGVDAALRAWSVEAAPAIALAVATTLDAPIDDVAAATRDANLQLAGFAERFASIGARLERIEALQSESPKRAAADAALRSESLFERLNALLEVAETRARNRADELYERLSADAAAHHAGVERIEALLGESSTRATADAALRSEALIERLGALSQAAETRARERADALYERLAVAAAARADALQDALFEAASARARAFEDAVAERIAADVAARVRTLEERLLVDASNRAIVSSSATRDVQRDTQLIVKTQGEILVSARLTARAVEEFARRPEGR